MPPGYNHPARVAERIAALDLVSDGRVEFGTGESASILELGGYRVDVAEKRAAWRESVEQCLNMMVMTPYPGYEGKFFSMPCRNVVPKPLQKPHPPVWVACSNRETIQLAARLGIGALTFAFVDPAEAKQWVEHYYRILKTECVPIGHAVNANIAMVTGFSVHADAEEAKRRGEDDFKFFRYALGHHYIFGEHKPGHTDIWAAYEKARGKLPEAGAARGIGTPEQLRAHLKSFEDSGVDQVAFIQQGGRNRHEHICQSLELFAREVLPEFDEREEARAKHRWRRTRFRALSPSAVKWQRTDRNSHRSRRQRAAAYWLRHKYHLKTRRRHQRRSRLLARCPLRCLRRSQFSDCAGERVSC
jgi:alkanesulfonate monooxygenase SsuD/methylene tetrahydromethanopterin reductase-like flavin-dependent oxidoreductase (luciferase family)